MAGGETPEVTSRKGAPAQPLPGLPQKNLTPGSRGYIYLMSQREQLSPHFTE